MDGKTKEETGESLFEKLLQLDLIMACYNEKIHIVNECQIHLGFCYMIKFPREVKLFDFDSKGMLHDKIVISTHAYLWKRRWQFEGAKEG